MEEWTHEERLCYIAHLWADKENETGKECLQDFDYFDMAIAAKEFIDSFSNKCAWATHVENCFDKLVLECEGQEIEWTKEFFDQYY